MNKGFSIAVCSYNPDITIFKRLIAALDSLTLPQNTPVEFIVIDNNSQVPIKNIAEVKCFLELSGNRKYIAEPKPGLTEARIRACMEAQYDWVIFFDDDNEPEKSYLVKLEETIEMFSEVYCWGPAEIKVQFLNKETVNDWIQTKKFYFQERNWEKTEFGINSIWQSYFPYGTGLVVHKCVLLEYIKRIANGQYSLSDRKGKSLSSGGDLQIVLTATDMGLQVGTINGLSVNHLIASKKSIISYLERQVYGTSSSYVAAHKQVNKNLFIDEQLVTNWDILKRVSSYLRVHLFKSNFKDVRLGLAELIGGMNARFVYLKIDKRPYWIRLYEIFINA